MKNLFIYLIAGVALFYWLGGFELLAMRKRGLLKKAIKPVYQSPEREQLLKALHAGSAVKLTQIDALLLAQGLIGNETWPEAYHLKNPSNASFTFLYAYFLMCKGWHIRGGGAGNQLSQDAAIGFTACLQQSEESFKNIMVTSTIASDCYVPLLNIYRGISKYDDATALYQHYAPRANTQLDFHIGRIAQTAPRWNGNMDEMLTLAHQLSERGGVMAATLAAGWIEFTIEENSKALRKKLSQNGEKALLITAFKQLKPTPHQINNHEDYMLALANNCFALALCFAGEKKLARLAFKQTSGFYTNYPWKLTATDIASGFYSTAVECKVDSFNVS